MGPFLALPGAVFGASRGRFWRFPGPLLTLPGPFLALPGTVSGASRSLFGRFRGRMWRFPGPNVALPEPLLALLGPLRRRRRLLNAAEAAATPPPRKIVPPKITKKRGSAPKIRPKKTQFPPIWLFPPLSEPLWAGGARPAPVLGWKGLNPPPPFLPRFGHPTLGGFGAFWGGFVLFEQRFPALFWLLLSHGARARHKRPFWPQNRRRYIRL